MTEGPGRADGATAADDTGTWTVLRLIRWSGEYLDAKGVERGRLDGEHLLAETLGTTRLQLYLQFDRPLTPDELARFKPLLLRRAKREPLQYILGKAAFRELELAVDPRVLIPRPETEVLVEEVLAWAKSRPEATSALDLGTGSGCIALSLAHEGPFERVVAVDASADALDVARANAAAADVGERVELRRGDLWAALGDEERFHVVVSNPPYVAAGERDALEPEVAAWEPGDALFAGEDGLDALRRIVEGAAAHLHPQGLLALEVGLGQAHAVARALADAGGFREARVRPDLTGRPRIVLAERA